MKQLIWCVIAVALSACSTDDFFYGEMNTLPPKELSVSVGQSNHRIAWRTDLGSESALGFVPAIGGDTVYAVEASGRLTAVDLNTGQKRFSQNLDNEITAGLTLGNQVLFMGTKTGDVLAVSALDGGILWREPVGSTLIVPPVYQQGLLVVRTIDGAVSAFDAQQGELLWRQHLPIPKMGLIGQSQPLLTPAGLMVMGDSGHFTVLNPMTGSIINQQLTTLGVPNTSASGLKFSDMNATPKIIPQGLLFGSVSGLYTFALDLNAGAQLAWESSHATHQDFTLAGGALFLVDEKDHVYALRQDSGEVIWWNNNLEGRRLSPPFFFNGQIGVLDFEGHLHWLDFQSGAIQSRQKISSGSASYPPLIVQEKIIWQLDNGHLIAVE